MQIGMHCSLSQLNYLLRSGVKHLGDSFVNQREHQPRTDNDDQVAALPVHMDPIWPVADIAANGINSPSRIACQNLRQFHCVPLF